MNHARSLSKMVFIFSFGEWRNLLSVKSSRADLAPARHEFRQIPTNSDIRPRTAEADNGHQNSMEKLLCLLLACCSWTMANAFMVETDATHINLVSVAQVLEDPAGALTLEDVQSAAMAPLFRTLPSGGADLNFGFSGSAIWLRIPLQRMPHAAEHWLLEIAYNRLDQLAFYAPGQPAVRTGSDHALNSRPLFHRYFAFPLQLAPDSQFFYIRAKSDDALTLPLWLWAPDRFNKHQQSVLMVQFLYYGGLLSLLLYNLLLYVSVRDKRFLLYSLYVATFALGMLAGNGYGRLFLWPDAAGFDHVAQSIFLSLAAYWAVRLVRFFYQTRQKSPRMDHMLAWSGGTFLLITLAMLASLGWTMPLRALNQLFMANALVMGVLVFWASWRAWRSGERSARFFLLAWSILWLGVVLAALRALGWLPSNTLTGYALQIASAFEMVLLSLALADMIHEERDARDVLQRQALEMNLQMVRMLKNAEESLERNVQERTEQLRIALAQEKAIRTQYVRFGSLISHEFRNPLAIINSQLTLMRREHESGLPLVQKRMQTMGQASKRLAHLFDKWLQGDRLAGSLETINPSLLDLRNWLVHLSASHAHLLQAHTVKWKLAPAVETVWADPSLLETALTNLLENACKYSAPQSVVQIETHARPGQVGIAVVDQGIGIAPQDQDAVFDEFFRVSPETSLMGMGLGLSIVKRVVLAHGGEIELQSEVGQGSSFCLWFPLPAQGLAA
jgi:signal transduction histidine kinase